MVQGAPAPDLKDCNGNPRGYILFKKLSDVQFVLDHWAWVQANNSLRTLGLLQTGMYARRVWLHKVPIFVTVDDSAQWNSAKPRVHENMFEVLERPCYQ